MLLSLPVELVERILRLALPEEITSSTYPGRQATLRSFCLVSSALRRLAQPILEEAVYVKSKFQFKLYTSSEASRGGRCRLLWLVLAVEGSTLAPLVSHLHHLTDLRLAHLRGLNLSILCGSRCLQRLVLWGVHLKSAPFVLQNVTELTVFTSTSSSSLPALSSASFPALRNLAFLDSRLSTLEDLYGQLTTLIHSTSDRNLVASAASAANCSTMHDVGAYEVGDSPFLQVCQSASSCRVFHSTADVDDEEEEVAVLNLLEEAADTIQAVGPSALKLKRLYLPTAFSAECLEGGENRSALEALLQTCTARGIAVDFEDTDEATGASLISPKFVEYTRRQVEAKRDQEIA